MTKENSLYKFRSINNNGKLMWNNNKEYEIKLIISNSKISFQWKRHLLRTVLIRVVKITEQPTAAVTQQKYFKTWKGEVYRELWQPTKMEFFAKIINGFQLANIFAKRFVIRLWTKTQKKAFQTKLLFSHWRHSTHNIQWTSCEMIRCQSTILNNNNWLKNW